MRDPFDELRLVVAGHELTGPWDKIRRYCGLVWSGGPPETWAYRYYETLETDPELVRPVDVPVLRGDASLVHEATGWQPTIPLTTTLADVLASWEAD